MLYTFHHIFSLPRGWLRCTLITSQGKTGKHRSKAHRRWKRAFNKKPTSPFFVASLSAFSAVCRHFYTHSADDSFKLAKINRACKERALLAARDKSKTQHPQLHPPNSLSSPHLQDRFQHHGQRHKRCCFMSKIEVSLEQCPCFGAQRDTLLLCSNTHILIDCVPNSVKERQTVTQIGTCCLRQIVTVEVCTWSLFNQMYWALQPLLSNSKRNVVTARSFDTQENPCTT